MAGANRRPAIPDPTFRVRSLVPDRDGDGYWLVAADGGIFAFNADFRGSMGGTRLSKPVTGMIAYGNEYLMVTQDGGIFNFSDRPFSGSLGSTPPPPPRSRRSGPPRLSLRGQSRGWTEGCSRAQGPSQGTKSWGSLDDSA